MKFSHSLLAICSLLTCVASAQQAGLTRETWTNLPKNDSLIVLQREGISKRAANSTAIIPDGQFVGPTVAKSGTRLRGTITPAFTDSYTFWVSGKDNVALWISEDGSRFNKKLVAYHLGFTNVAEWDKHAYQKSIPIQLTAGQSYYLEAQAIDENGGGHIAVAWRGQSGRYTLNLNGATATQSSTQWEKDPSRLIDGNTSGVWGNNEVSLTENLPNSWVAVDFGQDRDINQVVLYNRSNAQNYLSNFRISVLDANDTELVGQNFFTTSGNVGNSMVWNLPSTVQGARKVKVQLLGFNLAGNGHLSLAEIEAYGSGLVEGRVDHREILPSNRLASLQADPADLNDNNLADAWELEKGLTVSSLPGALLEYGDPDKDGMSNFQEQWLGSDPLTKEALANGITRHIWMGVGTSGVSSLKVANDFYYYPNSIEHVPGVDSHDNYKNLGVRYRGTIIPPVTGNYRFWITAGGTSELWLADGSIVDPATNLSLTNRFGKKLIASSSGSLSRYNFDASPKQRSQMIHLVQGQEYYIEVLHSQGNSNNDQVALAWQALGGEREIIPAEAFLSNNSETNDADDDNLPDSWELTKGFSTTKNGYNDIKESEYGDPDADKLTNLLEFQHGTNPRAADTDGDSYSDHDEIFFYGTNPLVSNNLNPVTVTLPQLNQYTQATGSWSTNSNGSLTALDRRGGITYTFTVAEPGIHEVTVSAGAISNQPWITKYLNITLAIDSEDAFAKGTITSANSNTGTLRAITPWLTAGTHTLTIYHENMLTELRMRLDGVSVKRFGGADLNQDGIPDWITDSETQANKLTRITTSSRTSPLSIEGMTRQLSSVSLQASVGVPPASPEPQSIPVNASINNTFFADVPLSADADVTLTASYLSGLVTETHSISWIATNLFEFNESELNIRVGDSLRITAHAPSEPASGTFTLQGSEGVPSLPTEPQSSSAPIPLTFDTAGTYTITATWTPTEGSEQTATVTIKVHGADLGSSHLVRVGTPNTWTPPTLGASHIVESDDHLSVTETTTSGARNFRVKADKPINRHVIARLPEGVDGAPSAILARGTVHAFEVGLVDQTKDAQIVHRYEDGTWLLRNTFVAINLPDGVTIRMTQSLQGTLFTNGSNILELTNEDFDANGIAEIYYEYTGTIVPKLCHTVQVIFQP